LKRRFLLTIGIVLAAAIGSVGILQYILFRSEQYRLIDSRIEATATLLISSELSRADLKDFNEAEDIISDVVGGEKFNQFIVIYKKTGEEIYRSKNAEELPDVIPRDEKWQTIVTNGHIIRVLTLPLARPRTVKHPGAKEDTRILQTGLILDEDLLRMKTLSRHVIAYSVLILGFILLTTFWLAEVLLRPLKELANYLRHMSSRLEVSPDISASEPPVPPIKNADDEFGQLVVETRRLHNMIGRGLKNTQAWTAQMAHEMKTPLTILQNSIERARSETEGTRRELQLKEATDEIAHLNALISSFLEWSAAENYPEIAEDLHAVRLGMITRELSEKFARQNPGRIQFEGDSGLRVFAKRGFVQQAVSNLITNALRYSPLERPVFICVFEDRIEIKDEGPGLPQHVVDHLGEPFNYGAKDRHGFGLGLAWVRTICRKYGWTLSFSRTEELRNGANLPVTCVSIRFPAEEV